MLKKICPSARYTLAIAVVGVAVLVRMFLNPLVADYFPFFSFYIAVAVTTWCAGWGPGLLALILGWLSTNIFFAASGLLPADPLAVPTYLVISLVIVIYGASVHRSRARAENSEALVREKQKELEHEIACRHQAEQALQLIRQQTAGSSLK